MAGWVLGVSMLWLARLVLKASMINIYVQSPSGLTGRPVMLLSKCHLREKRYHMGPSPTLSVTFKTLTLLSQRAYTL